MSELLNQLSNLLEQDNKGVAITCYSIALIGFTVAVRKVRPFSRFRKPSDIPERFIQERTELSGYVNRIEPNGSLLMVKHKPLIKIPGLSDAELPVKISEVDVSMLGVSWLQTIVAGNDVRFVAVKKEKDAVHCEVVLPQTTADKKLRKMNVGEALISVGFGTIADKPIETDEHHLNYYKRLQKAEMDAIRKKLGMKYYILPTKQILGSVGVKLKNLVMNVIQPVTVQEKKVSVT